MKIVIAPDSFKGSVTAKEACQAIENGFCTIFPDATYCHLPLADGGEGTLDVLIEALAGERKTLEVQDPFGQKTNACWALIDKGQTALIELASASGLDLTTPENRNPLITTTFGTGELIKAALDEGVNTIVLGLGGSATNDGGAGIIQALGGKLLTADGREISQGGAALAELSHIDLSFLHPRCAEVKFILACDVDNPLCGSQGASTVFGPQKGATPEMVAILEQALLHFSTVVAVTKGQDHKNSAGFGAAGGTPLGLSLAFELEVKSGIEMVLDILDADTLLENATLVITGEGQMDNQTLQGKTPFGIAQRAKQKQIPVIGIAGSLGIEIEGLYPHIHALFGTVRSPQPLSQVIDEASENITRTARNIAALLKMGKELK